MGWNGYSSQSRILDAVNLLVGLEKPENLEKVKKQSKEKKSNIVLLIEENLKILVIKRNRKEKQYN